jgi:hypothetical protein
MSQTFTKAIFLTGAAARISQEVALLDQLIAQANLTVQESDTLIAGFSSGSLNLLGMNGCFRANNPLDWDKDYKEGILWGLQNSDVYVKDTDKLKLHIFDTSPLRNTLNAFLQKQGVNQLSELPFQSYVITFSDHLFKTQWATNIAGAQNSLVLSDLFMASTAIPIVFPWQPIRNVGTTRNFPEGHFSDGGTGGTFKHFEDYFGPLVLQQGGLDEMYIISPMRQDGTAEASEMHAAFAAGEIKDGLKDALDKFAASISFGTFFKFLTELDAWNDAHQGIIKQISVNIPRLANNFGILDFTKEKAQYDATVAWVQQNPADFNVPLKTFIAQNNPKA